MEDWWIGGGLRRISPKAEPRSGRGGGNDGFEGAPPSVLCVQELLSRGDGDGFGFVGGVEFLEDRCDVLADTVGR